MGLPQHVVTDVWPRPQSGPYLVTWPCPRLPGPFVRLCAYTGYLARLAPTLMGVVSRRAAVLG